MRKAITIEDVKNLLDKYHREYEFHSDWKVITYFFENGDRTRIEIVDDGRSVSFMGIIVGGLDDFERRVLRDDLGRFR